MRSGDDKYTPQPHWNSCFSDSVIDISAIYYPYPVLRQRADQIETTEQCVCKNLMKISVHPVADPYHIITAEYSNHS